MKKLIALFLCFALLLPFALPAAAASFTTEKSEVLSLRDTYSKTYLLPDGSYQYVGRAEPIHYKDSSGSYVPINNAITSAVKRAGYTYTNTANKWNAHFSEQLNSSNAVMLTSGKHSVAFSFAEQTGTAGVVKATDISNAKDTSVYHQKLSADNRAVIYRDVAENVDIAYTVLTGALKEDIILKSKAAPSVYKFRLTANGLTLKETSDTVALFTAEGEEVFSFAPLYMEDANGKRSEKVSLTYTGVKNGYELTVSADTEFLNAVDTVYPVTTNFSKTIKGSGVTYDTCVDEQYPTSNYHLSENLWTGGANGINTMYTYLRFNINGTGILPLQVTSAYINLVKKEHQPPNIQAYRVTADWSSSAITWNNKPAFDSNDHSPLATSSNGTKYSLDVTEMAKDWLDYSLPNYGVALKDITSANNSAQKTKFYSSDTTTAYKPELVINYEIYYGSRRYQTIPSAYWKNSNCMGYALEFEEFILPSTIVSDTMIEGMTLEEVESTFYHNLETWMDLNLGASNWCPIADQHSNIYENWYRVYCQITFRNGDHDNTFDLGENFGFHWMYQTNTGVWAYKNGNVSTGETQLSDDFLTQTGGQDNTASTFMFFQVRDIRSVAHYTDS